MIVDAKYAFEALARVSLEAKLVHRAYRPLYANGAFADMFLYDDPAEALAQSTLLPVFDAETRTDPDAAWAALLAAPGAVFGRRVFNRRNGALFRAEFVARRVAWRDGPAVAMAILDVSEEERACRALTAARAEAESAAGARRALFAAAARSLGPPVRAARTHLGALAKAGGDGAETAAAALRACDDLLARVAHVGELLGEEGAARAFDLRVVLARAAEHAAAAFPEARLSVRIGSTSAQPVLGAAQRLERAAFALIESAAVRATDVAFVAAADDGGLALQVEARGAGAGAPEAHSAALAVARALAEAEGGAIVTRAPSRDLWAAHAYLPLSRAPEIQASARSCDVLVVEDNAAAMRLTCTLLRALGHCATGVESGAAALAALSARRFDLVLMDVQLPGMDGIETTRRIRALARAWADLPVAAMTANARADLRAAASEAGMNAFLLKPIDAAALAAQIALLTAPMNAIAKAMAPGPASIEAAELHQIEEEDQNDEAADEVDRFHAGAPAPVVNPFRFTGV